MSPQEEHSHIAIDGYGKEEAYEVLLACLDICTDCFYIEIDNQKHDIRNYEPSTDFHYYYITQLFGKASNE